MRDYNNLKPLFPTLSFPSINQSPIFSQIAEKRLAIQKINNKIQNSHFQKRADISQLLYSLKDQKSCKFKKLTSNSLQPIQRRPIRQNTYQIKQRRLSKHVTSSVDDKISAFINLKCSSVFTRKNRQMFIKIKTEQQSIKPIVSSMIFTPKSKPTREENIDDNQYKTPQKQRIRRRKTQQHKKQYDKSLANIVVQDIKGKQDLENKNKRTKHISFKPQMVQKTTKSQQPILQYNLSELKHIKAESFCVIESSGQIILSQRSNKPLEIASLTKIMTAHLILRICKDKNLKPSEEKMIIKSYVQGSTGTTAQLIHGDIYTIQQLLFGLLLPSGNDAALVLADWGGKRLIKKDQTKQKVKSNWKNNINKFVQQMNSYAKTLELKDTQYGNPHGLPHPEAKSTAFDQCKLSSFCLQNQLFKVISKTQKFSSQVLTSQGKTRSIYWQNTNKLLRRQGFIGLKTGITVTAGPCLITAFEFKQKIFITTVLRSNKVSRRFKQNRKIIHFVLLKLYSGMTCFQQTLLLQNLGRNDKELDSDYSQDQQIFNYKQDNPKQLARRNKILRNQL